MKTYVFAAAIIALFSFTREAFAYTSFYVNEPSISAGDDDDIDSLKSPLTVIVDAGHGGDDSGARGVFSFEKDIVLAIALKVNALLSEYNIRSIMSRKADYFVPLPERTRFANMKHGDLFVSIHLNSGRNKKAKGFEIYYLSERASDREALELSTRENQVVIVDSERLGTSKAQELKDILSDMAKESYLRESGLFASVTADVFYKLLGTGSRGVRQAPFYVLHGAHMPAILIEVDFISNPEEEPRLNLDSTHDMVARAIVQSIFLYVKTYKKSIGEKIKLIPK